MNIKETLKERNSVYGDYLGGIDLRHSILNACERRFHSVHGCEMSPRHKEYLWDIVNKLTRIAVTPNHMDSWKDIEGYAKLVQESISHNPTSSTEDMYELFQVEKAHAVR